MILSMLIIVGIFLLAMAIIDLKYKEIPSIFLTAMILFLVIVNIREGPALLSFGIAGFVFAYLLYEFDHLRGMADIKALTIISLTISTLVQFGIFMILVGMISIMYQLVALKILNKDIKSIKDIFQVRGEIPFVPAIFIIYIILMFFFLT